MTTQPKAERAPEIADQRSDEAVRLAALRRYRILDTEPEI
jgi:hypothetical protein